jgi:uncharacterized cupredoxin-like copper-binding protein
MDQEDAVKRVALPAIAGLAVVIAACGPGATEAPAPTESPDGGPVRVEVDLTDALRMDPDMLSVPVGVPVTFVVANVGVIDHEFVVGDEAVQDEHEQEMQDGGMHTGDEDNAISVEPGETKELTMTFDAAGSTLAGCHIPGHYLAGMKATITVGG